MASISLLPPPMEEEEDEEIVWEIGEIGSPRGYRESTSFEFDDQATAPPTVDLPASPSSSSSPSPTRGSSSPIQGSSSPTQGHDHADFTPGPGYVRVSNKRRRVPACSKAIDALREVPAPTDSGDDCCAICLHDFDSSCPDDPETTLTTLRAMPCSHTFHQRCIFEWLRRNAVCPLCRHQLPTDDGDQEQEQEQERERRRSSSRSGTFYNVQTGMFRYIYRVGDELSDDED